MTEEKDWTERDAEYYEKKGGKVPLYYQRVTPTEPGRGAWRPSRHPGSQRFHEILRSVGDMHDQKQRDYGTDSDPFANVRASEEFGIPAWLGAVIRMNDKVSRLKTAAHQIRETGESSLTFEGVEDSLLDIAVYAIISLVLYEEGQDETQDRTR